MNSKPACASLHKFHLAVDNVHLHLELGSYKGNPLAECAPFKFDKVYNPRMVGKFPNNKTIY